MTGLQVGSVLFMCYSGITPTSYPCHYESISQGFRVRVNLSRLSITELDRLQEERRCEVREDGLLPNARVVRGHVTDWSLIHVSLDPMSFDRRLILIDLDEISRDDGDDRPVRVRMMPFYGTHGDFVALTYC